MKWYRREIDDLEAESVASPDLCEWGGSEGARRKVKRAQNLGGSGGRSPPDVGENLEKCSKISIRKLNFNKKLIKIR